MSINKKRRSTGRVTLADVAQLAGVGSMTVSRALRTPEQVSDKLREKLKRPSASSAICQSGRQLARFRLFLHHCDDCPKPVRAGLCRDVCRFAKDPATRRVSNHAGRVAASPRTRREAARNPALLQLSRRHLLSVEHSPNVRNWLDNTSIPVLEIGALTESPIDMNIGIDNVEAMYQLTKTVIDRGYKNIGMLCANQEQWIFQQHLQGWHKAMLKAHMSVHRVINSAEPANFTTGARQLPEFLLAWPELDALVCVSDELACGVLYECQRRRVKVPDDLAVVGFGNSDVSKVCQPPLTTIAIPHKEIGIRAAQALLARINDEEWEEVAIASSLCRRDSC
ncbi:Gluconate utilization system GNT-I transcriptional repressor [Ewingella americana]|uniref:Gluconate utilization system GNT-I transcriptional repressor n=1 Tax=Ewingella americana TaxID=41202 RepID=A0A377N9S1_9GAMM|nr:Gluconate utilization system GNT-I transcriptional repressor [Ewingella americana]